MKVGQPWALPQFWGAMSQEGGAIGALPTVKVYAAAISSCHEGFGGRSAFSQPLMLRFLRGVRGLRPVVHASAPQWDLPLVLEALVTEPFEPLELSSLKALSWKTACYLP